MSLTTRRRQRRHLIFGVSLGGSHGTGKFRPHVNPAKEQPHDSMEEAIRRRQHECDERKRKTLEAYDKAQRSRPAGVPVSVYVPSTDGVEPVVELGKLQNIRDVSVAFPGAQIFSCASGLSCYCPFILSIATSCSVLCHLRPLDMELNRKFSSMEQPIGILKRYFLSV